MKKYSIAPKNSRHLRRACLTAALISSVLSAHAVTTLNGNHTIVATTTPLAEAGNLVVTGDLSVFKGLDVGTTGDPAVSAFQLDWYTATKIASFDLTEPSSSYHWRDNLAAGTAVRKKMTLSDTNILSLFKQDGSAAGITLDPTAGSVTLAGLTSGIYHSNGTPMVSFSSTGTVTFPSRPIFSSGIDFGSGKILNNSNVGYMRDLITDFGYVENPIVATAIKNIKLVGAGVSSVVGVGSHLYVVGNFDGNPTVGDSGYGPIDLSYYGVSRGSFVAKLDANGEQQWIGVMGGFGSDAFTNATSVAVDSSGNVLVAGSFAGTMQIFDDNGFSVTSSGRSDGYVAKFNSNGLPLWAEPIGGTSIVVASSVAVDNSGNVFVGGSFSGATTNLHTNIISAGNTDGYVAKFHSDGGLLWAKPIGGASYDSESQVAVDNSGNVYVAGSFQGTTINSTNITGLGNTDGYVAKFQSNGLLLWAKPIGGASYDSARSVAVDSSGNVYVAGSFQGTTISPTNIISAGMDDVYVGKWNVSGVHQWSKRIGGIGSDLANSIRIESSGDVLVSGNFSGTTVNLEANITSAGSDDGFLVRLAANNGSALNTLSLGGKGRDGFSGSALLGSEIYTWGRSASESSMLVGNALLRRDSFFLIGLPSFNIVTPPSILPVKPLAWSGGVATGLSSIALGGESIAGGANSVALGSGSSTGIGSLSFGMYGQAVGNYSIALGGKALGEFSVALGYGNATGDRSVTLGNSIASGQYAIALGFGGKATAYNSVAVAGGIASGLGSFAIGSDAKASGYRSFIGGASPISDGNSVLIKSEVSGHSSFAWGSALFVTGRYSHSFGSLNTVSADNSTAFGTRIDAQSNNSFVLGRWNKIQGSPTSWVTTDDLFVVGNGDSTGARSNALTTLKNGQTTLTNKEWKTNNNVALSPSNSNGEALVVEGHTRLNGTLNVAGTLKSGGSPVLTSASAISDRFVQASPSGVINLSGTTPGISANTSTIFALDAAGKVNFPSTRPVSLSSIVPSFNSTSGALTVAGGLGVLKSMNIGEDSYINGVRVGRGLGDAPTNVAIGQNALSSNTPLGPILAPFPVGRDPLGGQINTAVGTNALYSNTGGFGNSALGSNSLRSNTTGDDNIAIGTSTLEYNTEGNSNTSLGRQSLGYNIKGNNNVAVGNYAGSFQQNGNKLTSPENSIYIGSKARGLNNDDNNSIVIGHEAVSAGPNSTVIGGSLTTKTFLMGETNVKSLKVTENTMLAGSATIGVDATVIGNTSTTALTVSGVTTLNGQVIITQQQGDISMGVFGAN
jgi:Beta-propeller repeat/Head domain of trimeric autotransporter adhesin